MKRATVEDSIPISRLREYLAYDPLTGDLTWLVQIGKYEVGRVVSTQNDSGYLRVCVGGKRVRAHRAAWALTTGMWPPLDIDHVNGIRHDNRWANLRLVTAAQNSQNSKRRSSSRSGFKGVFWCSQKNKWMARITVGRRQIHLGFFATPESGHEAYIAAAKRYFGSYASAG